MAFEKVFSLKSQKVGNIKFELLYKSNIFLDQLDEEINFKPKSTTKERVSYVLHSPT